MTNRPSRIIVLAVVATLAILAAPSSAVAAPSWTVIPSPNPGDINTIGGLTTFGPSEIWAIGATSKSTYTGCHGRTLTARFNGSAFSEVPGGLAPICASVNGVAGISTSNIWAVGSTNNGRDTHIRHWNGSDWATVPGALIQVPPSGGRGQRSTGLNAVAALGPNDIWAVGRAQFIDFTRRALAEHWNGTAWSLVPVPANSGSELMAVAAISSDNVWAAGKGPSANGSGTLIEHWNGSAWSVVPSPNANVLNNLRGLAAVSANDIWAVGDSTKSVSDGVSSMRTLIEHWNGSSWSIVPSPNVGTSNNSLAAVAARSASDVWAVGYSIGFNGDIPILRTLTMHWNGTSWTVVPSANASNGDNSLTAVAIAAGSPEVWASGASSVGTLIERFS